METDCTLWIFYVKEDALWLMGSARNGCPLSGIMEEAPGTRKSSPLCVDHGLFQLASIFCCPAKRVEFSKAERFAIVVDDDDDLAVFRRGPQCHATVIGANGPRHTHGASCLPSAEYSSRL